MRAGGGYRRTSGYVFLWFAISLFFLPVAHASLAVLLEEPYGPFSHLSPSGHVSVYFDNICAETPVLVRRCRSGELGVIISRYNGIDNRDWVAIPLLGYLYSVGRTEDIPSSVNRQDVSRFREAYRQQFLMALVPNHADGTAPDGNRYELADASFDRAIYGFQVKTTPEQDTAQIAFLNDRPNRAHYNGALRNCADFVRDTVNRFYPHAIHRNYIADLGITSPKSVARGLAHYAAKHPQTEFTTFRIPQVGGGLPRSHPAVTLAEGVFKEFGIPLLVVSPPATAIVFAAYLIHGHFYEPTDAPVLSLHTTGGIPPEPTVAFIIPSSPGETPAPCPSAAASDNFLGSKPPTQQ